MTKSVLRCAPTEKEKYPLWTTLKRKEKACKAPENLCGETAEVGHPVLWLGRGSSSQWADFPECHGFFCDDVWHLFGEEEICCFDATDAAGAGEVLIEPLCPLDSEEGVFQPPDHSRRTFPLA